MLSDFLRKTAEIRSTNLYRIQFALENLIASGTMTTYSSLIAWGNYNEAAVTNALKKATDAGVIKKDDLTKTYIPLYSLGIPNLSLEYYKFLKCVLDASLIGSDLPLTRLLFALAVEQKPVKISDLQSLLLSDRTVIFAAYNRIDSQLGTKIVLYDPSNETMEANIYWY